MSPPKDHHQLEWSEDGQPFSQTFGDHFYSHDDGRAEAAHVFVDGNDVTGRWNGGHEFIIGELGFGTGLNFLETWHQWRATRLPDKKLHFISIEAYPLDRTQIAKALSTWPELDGLTELLLNSWETVRVKPVHMDQQTTLRVVEAEAFYALDQFPGDVDAWYLDGFSPARNPDMWSGGVMSKIAAHTTSKGTFASYTSAGWVRRNLEAAGFHVEKRPGFGRKRNMIAGRIEATK